jgi:hypothetical protein
MSENKRSSQDAWRALQEISKREREHAQKRYQTIRELMDDKGEVIPKNTLLKELGFKSFDEMIDWELDWLPRKELNIKFQYDDKNIRIIKDAMIEEDLCTYEYF